jgi:hypothetical protein
MASMKRLRRDLTAALLAAVCTLGIATVSPVETPELSATQARAEGARYLDAAPKDARLRADRWQVSDGHDTAWLDAKSGDLVEIEFAR